MLNKIIVLVMILLLVVLVLYLLHDSPLIGQVKSLKGKTAESVANVKKGKRARITDSPVIFVKVPGEKSYSEYPMYQKKITIGHDKHSDIYLEDDTVEKTHATVEKVVKDDNVYFELVNLSKHNPVQYLNQEVSKYQYLGLKKGVVLEGNEVFRIGETKVIVKCPIKSYEPSKTDRMIMNENVHKEAEKEAADSYEKEKTYEKAKIYEELEEVEDLEEFEEEQEEAAVVEETAAPTIRIEKADRTIVYTREKR